MEKYTHGHDDSVLTSHRWRTVKNSAKFLTPYLKGDEILLDIGCGPGNISAELSTLLPTGKVLAGDISELVLEEAQINFPMEKYPNLEFRRLDIYRLPFPDDYFDVIYLHQVLQHLTKPRMAIFEIKRILKLGGMIAARDANYLEFSWEPKNTMLERWLELYVKVARLNGANPDGGAQLRSWFQDAEFFSVNPSFSEWIFESAKDGAWWGHSWAKRILNSDFAKYAKEYTLTNEAELSEISEAFLGWSNTENGRFIVPNYEIIAIK